MAGSTCLWQSASPPLLFYASICWTQVLPAFITTSCPLFKVILSVLSTVHKGDPPLSPQISLSTAAPTSPPTLFLLAWTNYFCPQPHLEVALLCHGLSSECYSSWWWSNVWVLPRLVILEEVREHLGSTWKRKKNPLLPCAFLFLVGHKAAHVLFRNLFWLVLSAYSSFPSLQKDFNPSKR